jgi:hypothetical protein
MIATVDRQIGKEKKGSPFFFLILSSLYYRQYSDPIE